MAITVEHVAIKCHWTRKAAVIGDSGFQGPTIVFCEMKKETQELSQNVAHKEEYQLAQVEQKVGITFKRIGVHSETEIIKASSEDAIRLLDSVPPAAIGHFEQSAENLTGEQGTLEAPATALTHFSGATSVDQRSVNNSNAGFVTMIGSARLQCQTLVLLGKNLKSSWVRILIPK
ncbi:hypothetical protein E5288_WYG014940 [Bos mutus]|uniref:DDX21/DDX50 dimerisation domain-containing protein n=1 Tax=Bos mutus TaxID=72004 RepID=A0A6B0RQD1_9CETA|nr:hypothetical protein [Bos mutus]